MEFYKIVAWIVGAGAAIGWWLFSFKELLTVINRGDDLVTLAMGGNTAVALVAFLTVAVWMRGS